MYPNQPQPPTPQPSPQDYLNQIAPNQTKKPLFAIGPKLFILLGAILVIIIVVLAAVINSLSQGARSPLEHLTARLTATATIATAAQKNLKNNDLRSLNSSLNLYLVDINSHIAAPMKSAGIDTTKLDKKVVSSEAGKDITDRLDNARLNAVYDRTYAREMGYQLETLITLMKQVYASTGSSELKAFLKTNYDKLAPTQESFSNFNAANG